MKNIKFIPLKPFLQKNEKYNNEDFNNLLKVFSDNIKKKIDEKDYNIIKSFIEKNWFGMFAYNIKDKKYVGYCFIKYPLTRPETMSQIDKNYRDMGIVTELRNYTLNFYKNKLNTNIIYSSVEFGNYASLKSLIKSGYILFDITKDGYYQLVKVLQYNK